jgi:hypothetical protein
MMETQGKTEKDNINPNKKQTQPTELVSPKAGTATSFPDDLTSSPSILTSSPTIINVILWMKKQAYEETTIKATAKRLKYLQKNCHLADPESIKLFVANKKCSNAFKESLIETYHIYMKSIGQQWNKPFYARYDKLPKI